MKVAKLLRLKSKDEKGFYKADGANEVMRSKAIITDEAVAESESNYKESGLLYIVDEEATAEREKAKEKPVKEDFKSAKKSAE